MSVSFASIGDAWTGAPVATKTSSGSGPSFASVASQTAGAASSTASTWANSGGSGQSGWSVDSNSTLDYFTIPYFQNRTLSWPTWRYPLILWILWAVLLGVFVCLTLVRKFREKKRLRGHGDPLMHNGFTRFILGCNVFFRKWTMLPIGSGRHEKGNDVQSSTNESDGRDDEKVPTFKWSSMWQPHTTSVGQWLTLVIGIVVVVLLCTVGADYLAPTRCLFSEGPCEIRSSGPPTKRDNPGGWNPFMSPLLTQPNHDTSTDWASSSRIGLVVYSMLPIIVTMGVKQWPMNIWATPWISNIHFDKTAFFHRWFGRLVWILSTAHMGLYLNRLLTDEDPYGKKVLHDAWAYWHFIFGWIAYGALTVICAMGFRPIRDKYYELFYSSHVLLVILFLVGCGLHHPADMWWCWAALILWAAEKTYRGFLCYYINGYTVRRAASWLVQKDREGDSHMDDDAKKPGSTPDASLLGEKQQAAPAQPLAVPNSQYTAVNMPTMSYTQEDYLLNPQEIPKGHALVQLLPGKTMRLLIHTAKPVAAAPGQFTSLNVPSVRPWEHHPYTIMSRFGVVPQETRSTKLRFAASPNALESEFIVLLVRKTKGVKSFSNALYSHMVEQRSAALARETEDADHEHHKPLFVRANITWPIGSFAGYNLNSYTTQIHICGGTGISFAASLVEAALVSARKAYPSRVYLVWLLRDQAHLIWAASQLKECMARAPPGVLNIKLFASEDLYQGDVNADKGTLTPGGSSGAHLVPPPPSAYGAGPALTPPEASPAYGSAELHTLASDGSRWDWYEAQELPQQFRTEHQQDSHSDFFDPEAPYQHSTHDYDEEDLQPWQIENFNHANDLRTVQSNGAWHSTGFAGESATHQNRRRSIVYRSTTEATPNARGLSEFDTDDTGVDQAELRVSNSLRKQGRARRTLSKRSQKTGPLLGQFSSYGGSPYFVEKKLPADEKAAGADAPEPAEVNAAERANVMADPVLNEATEHWDVGSRELADALELSEYFVPRQTSLDFMGLISDAANRSCGKSLVTACGPSTLTARIQTTVSALQDVQATFKGQPSGDIDFYCENFS